MKHTVTWVPAYNLLPSVQQPTQKFLDLNVFDSVHRHHLSLFPAGMSRQHFQNIILSANDNDIHLNLHYHIERTNSYVPLGDNMQSSKICFTLQPACTINRVSLYAVENSPVNVIMGEGGGMGVFHCGQIVGARKVICSISTIM